MSRWTFVILLLSTLIGGCASRPRDPGVPKGADLLTEVVSPAGQRSEGATPLQVPEDGTLYVFDVTGNRMLFSGALEAGDVIKLSWGGVTQVGTLPSRSTYKPAYERQVARYEVGRTYRVYYKPGETPNTPDPLEGSPLTQPFEIRDRTVNPVEEQGKK